MCLECQCFWSARVPDVLCTCNVDVVGVSLFTGCQRFRRHGALEAMGFMECSLVRVKARGLPEQTLETHPQHYLVRYSLQGRPAKQDQDEHH